MSPFVVGGVGFGALFGDTHVLSCGNLNCMRWEPVEEQGQHPSERYGHTMTLLDDITAGIGAQSNEGWSSTIAVFGGTSGQPQGAQETTEDFKDLWLLHVDVRRLDTSDLAAVEVLIRWSEVSMAATPSPSTGHWPSSPKERSRHTMCSARGRLLVFGGSTEAKRNGPSNPGSPEERNISVFQLEQTPSLATRCWGGSFDVSRSALVHCWKDVCLTSRPPPPQALEASDWRWVVPRASVYEPGREPGMTLAPSTFVDDMGALVNNPAFSDVLVDFTSDDVLPFHSNPDEDERVGYNDLWEALDDGEQGQKLTPGRRQQASRWFDDGSDEEGKAATGAMSGLPAASSKRGRRHSRNQLPSLSTMPDLARLSNSTTLSVHRFFLTLRNDPLRAMMHSGRPPYHSRAHHSMPQAHWATADD